MAVKIDFEIISHKQQRYPTAGDWFKKLGGWYFRISKFKDKRYSWLIFLHEVIEWAICLLQGVKQKDIDKFDMAYEKGRERNEQRAPCGCPFQQEPGDDIHAPYQEAHQVATECERIIAKALGVGWDKYEEAIDKL